MNNDWLDINVLEDYLDGKLDAKAMHFVERQALEDPFVAEALEGLKQSPKRKQTLSILQKQLYDRVSEKPIKRKLWGITTQRLSIAATATVAFIAVSILFFMRETNRRVLETAERKSKGVIVNLDTNTASASVKPSLTPEADINEAAKSALINKAIIEAKTGDLAKNNKAAIKPEAGYRSNSVKNPETDVEPPIQGFSEKKAVIAAAPATLSAPIVYSGNVVAENGSSPVAGAIVKLAGSKSIATTDANGHFNLAADTSLKNRNITVNADGFKEVSVQGTTDPTVIRMALSGNYSLNDIAMLTKSGTRKTEAIPVPKIILLADRDLNGKALKDITTPIPVSTIDYNKYLESNNKLYNPKGPEQFVVLGFKVKQNGRPTQLRIIKSLNKKADQEAKRLIQNGPDWVLPKKGTDQVEMSVKF